MERNESSDVELDVKGHRSRRGKRKGKSPAIVKTARHIWLKIVLLASALVVLGGVIWFFTQPKIRQQEVCRYVINYCDSHRKISVFELAYDLYSLYYRNNDVSCEYQVGDSPIYGGLPRRMDGGQALRILKNIGYWVGYDELQKTPAWVAYKLIHMDNPPPIPERPDQFETDHRTIAGVSTNDYTGSGYDRGHLAPNYAIARCFGENAQRETFLMSNIVPQKHSINAGNWKSLETKEAVNYPDRFETVWIIAGPVYTGKNIVRLPGGVPVPDAFYKIQVDEREGKIRLQAFLFKHGGTGQESLQTLLVSVDEIERLTGLDFFPALPKDVQEKLESTAESTIW